MQCVLKEDLKSEEGGKEKRMEQGFREVLG